jgi:hypothetical protein
MLTLKTKHTSRKSPGSNRRCHVEPSQADGPSLKTEVPSVLTGCNTPDQRTGAGDFRSGVRPIELRRIPCPQNLVRGVPEPEPAAARRPENRRIARQRLEVDEAIVGTVRIPNAQAHAPRRQELPPMNSSFTEALMSPEVLRSPELPLYTRTCLPSWLYRSPCKAKPIYAVPTITSPFEHQSSNP